jgi:3-hydroxyacyl-CoA dehydrogenase/enoyl-CoA hydratase/3-hydroxybutyryl-CoA epimerase
MSAMNEDIVHLVRDTEGHATLFLAPEQASVVTFNAQRMASLDSCLAQLEQDPPRSLVIRGPNLKMFSVGADINAIRSITDEQQAFELARQGQKVFARIEALPCRTVAAISGPCVGGGCELVLACDLRIATDASQTKVGLPETKLGIVPGFGGTQRMTRLLGLPTALDIILAGKTLPATLALKVGLVDSVVVAEELYSEAHAVATGKTKLVPKPLSLMHKLLSFTAAGRFFVRRSTAQSIKKKSGGHYPALFSALECCLLGAQNKGESGYEYEARELARCLVTPESKALVNLYFLTEASKNIGKSAAREANALHTLVIGAGTMGAGIAGELAKNKSQVILRDTSEQALQKAVSGIRSALERKKGMSEQERRLVLNRLETTTIDSPNLGNCQLVIEAIVEDLEIKKKVLSVNSKKLPSDAIIASNTSSLSITKLAAGLEDPGRVVGMHFFNPVDRMPLVEIVRGSETTNRTTALIAAITTRIGKFPIVVEDVPGFLVNRILSPYLQEAAYLLQDGYRIEDVDRCAKRFGMPMGPVRLLDEVGLDVGVHVAKILTDGYGERMRGPDLLSPLVAAGRLGKKSGGGFYDFADGQENVSPKAVALLSLKQDRGPDNDIQQRLIMRLMNEAVQSHDEGVAGKPGKEAADQIDLGTVMGIGFPPFRGGILYYADSLGAPSILSTLRELEKKCGTRFAPWSGIVKRAEAGKGFHEAI